MCAAKMSTFPCSPTGNSRIGAPLGAHLYTLDLHLIPADRDREKIWLQRLRVHEFVKEVGAKSFQGKLSLLKEMGEFVKQPLPPP